MICSALKSEKFFMGRGRIGRLPPGAFFFALALSLPSKAPAADLSSLAAAARPLEGESLSVEGFIQEREDRLSSQYRSNQDFVSHQLGLMQPLLEKSGFFKASLPVFRSFASYLSFLFVYHQLWKSHVFDKTQPFIRDDSVAAAEKKLRLKEIYADMEKALLTEGIIKYFRRNLSRNMILEAVRHSAETPQPLILTAHGGGPDNQPPFSLQSRSQGGVGGIYAVTPPAAGSGRSLLPMEALVPQIEYTYNLPLRKREELEGEIYQKIIDRLKESKAKAVAVNMSQNRAPLGVMRLARHIKGSGLDIYVAGYCSLTCSSYLLPAAKRIYIGPQGVILYRGELFSSMERELKGASRRAAEARAVFYQSFQAAGGGFELLRDKYDAHIEERFLRHIISKKGGPGLFYKFQEGIQGLKARSGKAAARLTSRQRARFVKASEMFSAEDLSLLHDFLFSVERPGAWIKSGAFEHIELNSLEEGRFFAFVGRDDSVYSYFDLLSFAHGFAKYNPFFLDLFEGEADRTGYIAPEMEKLDFIVPSVEALRAAGLNIVQGENSLAKLPPALLENSNYMIFGLEDAENCGFFKTRGRNYTYEEIQACLSRSN